MILVEPFERFSVDLLNLSWAVIAKKNLCFLFSVVDCKWLRSLDTVSFSVKDGAVNADKTVFCVFHFSSTISEQGSLTILSAVFSNSSIDNQLEIMSFSF